MLFLSGIRMRPGDNDEVIFNATVKVDGELDMAWMPYVFYVSDWGNGRGRWGQEEFQLVEEAKGEGGRTWGDWIITGVQDIARKVAPHLTGDEGKMWEECLET
jgi:hypothetical protein